MNTQCQHPRGFYRREDADGLYWAWSELFNEGEAPEMTIDDLITAGLNLTPYLGGKRPADPAEAMEMAELTVLHILLQLMFDWKDHHLRHVFLTPTVLTGMLRYWGHRVILGYVRWFKQV